MLEVTIKDLDTGEVLKRTTKLAAVFAAADGGIYSMVLGSPDSDHGIASMAAAMDTARDNILEKSQKAQAIYRLRDRIGTQKIVTCETARLFDEG